MAETTENSGNFLVIASSSAVVIALSWGGIQFPWSSGRVLVPLISGLVGLVGFIAYEATLAKHPMVTCFHIKYPVDYL
jgi:hypothetical protein